jgi:hypothetical protein
MIDLEFSFCTLGISLGLDCSVVEQLAGGAGGGLPLRPGCLVVSRWLNVPGRCKLFFSFVIRSGDSAHAHPSIGLDGI